MRVSAVVPVHTSVVVTVDVPPLKTPVPACVSSVPDIPAKVIVLLPAESIPPASISRNPAVMFVERLVVVLVSAPLMILNVETLVPTGAEPASASVRAVDPPEVEGEAWNMLVKANAAFV